MSSKYTSLVLVTLLFLLSLSVFVSGVVSHTGSEVKVTFGGSETTVQTALTSLWTTVETTRSRFATYCSYASSLSLDVPAADASGDMPAYGHSASQILVTLNGVSTTVQQVISTLDSVMTGLEQNCGAPPVPFDFVVRVDSGAGLSTQPACPDGYEWIAHVHGIVSSGIAMHSYESGNERQSSSGWFSLCVRPSSTEDKDITTVISSNLCNPSEITATSCPNGYSQIGSITRASGTCNANEPQLSDDTRTSVRNVAKGTLLICQKNAGEYLFKTGTDLCGSSQTLGHVIKESYVQASGYYSFCKDGAPSSSSTTTTPSTTSNGITMDDNELDIDPYTGLPRNQYLD